MKNKNLLVVYSPGVYLVGNSNAPKIVHSPLIFLGVQRLHKQMNKNLKYLKTKKVYKKKCFSMY